MIYCERAGQKAILIGKGGSKLKSIGAAARKEIESLLGTRVYLELHVIVEENWRESRYFVDSLDWRKQLEDLAQSKPDSRRSGEGNNKTDGLDGCPRFAPAYLGRKRRAKPHHCVCLANLTESSSWSSKRLEAASDCSRPERSVEGSAVSLRYSRTLMPRLFILRYR